MGTFECDLPFCKCRKSSRDTQRWWGHLNPTYCNQSCLNFFPCTLSLGPLCPLHSGTLACSCALTPSCTYVFLYPQCPDAFVPLHPGFLALFCPDVLVALHPGTVTPNTLLHPHALAPWCPYTIVSLLPRALASLHPCFLGPSLPTSYPMKLLTT